MKSEAVSETGHSRTIVTNNSAVFGWALVIGWIAGLGLMTAMFVRQNGVPGLSYDVAAAIVTGFWFIGLPAAWRFLSIPRTYLERDADGTVVRERWLIGSREERYPAGERPAAEIVEDPEGGGDPYFICRLVTPMGRVVRVAEGHRREDVEAACQRVCTIVLPRPER